MPKKSGGRNVGRAQRRHQNQARVNPPVPVSPSPQEERETNNGRAVKTPSAEAPRYLVAEKAAASSARRSASSLVQSAIDYSYVKHDLRRIGLLSGFVFVVLIVLTVWLR